MGDMREAFDDWKRYWKNRRKKHLADAQLEEYKQAAASIDCKEVTINGMIDAEPIQWTKHTEWHWSTMLNGEQLDYWPSGTKFRYKKKTYRGTINDVQGFIRNRRIKPTPATDPDTDYGV